MRARVLVRGRRSGLGPGLLLGLLVVSSPGPVGAQGRAHLDPSLRALLRGAVREAAERAPRLGPDVPVREQPLGGAVALDREGPGGAVRVGVFVRVKGPGGLAALRAAGAEIGTVAGDIVTARVPLAALELLAGSPELVALEAAPLVELVHDSSLRAIKADVVRQRVGSVWQGSTGEGVIIGIYDTGLDYRHEDFVDGSGRTRVLALWDQTTSSPDRPPPAPYTYGQLCTRASLQDGSCPQRDLNGHGTHVAGTAAGDGSAAGSGGTQYQYAGVAPAAELLVVKGGDARFSFDQIVDGVKWIFDEAQRLGRPVVVNLSLGARSGPHDGTTLPEQALDALVGPGRILVVAAGNDGSNGNTTPELAPRYLHARGVAQPGSVASFGVRVGSYSPRLGSCNDLQQLELWYEAADGLTVTVVRPDGSRLSAGPGQRTAQDAAAGRVDIDNASGGPNPENGDHQVLIQWSDCGTSGPPAEGVWTVQVSAPATATGQPYDLWLTDGSIPAAGDAGFDNGYVVARPGTARRAITVGAFVTRLCWPARTGATMCYTHREPLGDIAAFSAGGPTRDGRLKPEIAAPGKAIVSALSRDGGSVADRVVPDGVHWALEGTSMAAPHVTGAVALLLQYRPDLTPEEVRAVLARSAAQDAFTGRSYTGEPPGAPNNQWGYGKLDVRAALRELSGTGRIASVQVTPAADTLPAGARLQLRATARSAAGDSVPAVFFWTTSDPAVATVDATGLVTAHAPGAVTIRASAEGRSGSAAIQVVPPATLAVAAEPAPAPARASSARGARLPLLRLQLRVSGYEAVEVRALGFDVGGEDPGARLLLVRDENANGRADAGEPVLARADAPLRGGAPLRLRLAPDSLRVRPGEFADLVAALELSGAAPNGAAFEAAFVPEETRSQGVRSGRQGPLEQPAFVRAPPVRTTVLAAGELFAASENPVRSARVIFNFAERPSLAGVFTLTGRRVVDLLPRIAADGRVEWDLRNDDGSRVANGVYLVVFRIGATTVREKLIVARPAGPGEE